MATEHTIPTKASEWLGTSPERRLVLRKDGYLNWRARAYIAKSDSAGNETEILSAAGVGKSIEEAVSCALKKLQDIVL